MLYIKYLHSKTGQRLDRGLSSLWMKKISYLQQHPWKSVVPPLHSMAQAQWGTSHMLRCLLWVSGFFQTYFYIMRDTRNGTRTGAEWKFCIMSPEYWHSLAFFSWFPGFHKRQQTSWLWRSYKLLEIARNKQMGTKPHNMSTGKLQTTVWRIQKASITPDFERLFQRHFWLLPTPALREETTLSFCSQPSMESKGLLQLHHPAQKRKREKAQFKPGWDQGRILQPNQTRSKCWNRARS